MNQSVGPVWTPAVFQVWLRAVRRIGLTAWKGQTCGISLMSAAPKPNLLRRRGKRGYVLPRNVLRVSVRGNPGSPRFGKRHEMRLALPERGAALPHTKWSAGRPDIEVPTMIIWPGIKTLTSSAPFGRPHLSLQRTWPPLAGLE